ncbi:MAG: hypothetical protein IPO18_05505 [bacterium]|nr:hypothetical protein [bacterium]
MSSPVHCLSRRIVSTSRIRLRIAGLAGALFVMLAGVAVASADPADVSWSSDFGAPGLTGVATRWTGIIQATVNWNGTLVAAGDISHAGGTPVQNVVQWNGSEFESMGDGLNGTVTSLAVVGTTLYAAGDFTASGDTYLPNVARWTGSVWAPVGNGAPDDPTNLVLVADGSTLLLLGSFSTVDAPAVAARCLARWNGSAWSDVGGFAAATAGYLVAGARVGSTLYVGGYFDDDNARNYLNAFDGSTWTYNVAALDGEVQRLATVGSDLYLFGWFSGGDNGNVTALNLARWDGAALHPLTDDVSDVFGMGEDGGQLFVVGPFFNHPGPSSSWWNGSGWDAGPARPWGQFGSHLNTFARIGGDLFLAGNLQGFYDYTDGGVIKGGRNIVAWDGTRFRALGTGYGVADEGYVNGLTAYGGQLVATGSFRMIGKLGAAQGIAAWDGAQWNALDSGLNDPFGNPSGDQLTTWNGRLVVSGYFTGGADVDSRNIIAWNGSTWEGFNGGFVGQGAQIVDYDSELIAGGLLMAEVGSGAPLGQVARWTGAQWQTIGTMTPDFGASSTRLAVWNGNVVCAGLFDSINGVAAQNIARWNGSAWSAFGGGFDGRVTALAVHGGELFASGDFTASGANPLPGSIARWDGSEWVAVGTGLDYYADVMTSAGGKLFVVGNIGAAGGTPVTRIASWDGAGWAALGSGLGQGPGGNNLGALCLTAYDNDLFVGGFFNTAGDKSSQRIARWTLATTSAVEQPAITTSLRISHASANPSPGRTSFRLQLPAADQVDAAVFDLRGRLVARLLSGRLPAGEHHLAWDGRDRAGLPVGTGVYWVRVVTPRGQTSEKVVLLR